MKAIQKTICTLLAAMSVVLLFAGCQKAAAPFTVGFTKIKKSGNVMLDTTFDEMKANGIEVSTDKKNNRHQSDFHFNVCCKLGSGDPIRTDDRSGMKGRNVIAEKSRKYAKST